MTMMLAKQFALFVGGNDLLDKARSKNYYYKKFSGYQHKIFKYMYIVLDLE